MPEPRPSVLRILDANVNRAREALRVMEEYGRLVLDDAALTEAIKETRHTLAATVIDLERKIGTARGPSPAPIEDQCPDQEHPLIRSRDIVADVGCDVRTPEEYRRADAEEVVRVAGTRLAEALRTLEEYGKTVNAGFAESIEKIRYHAYEMQRRFSITVDARRRFAHVQLYVIVTESLCRGNWLATAEAALRGGADCLQLREKSLPDGVVLDRARQLVRLCREHNALCLVNDRPDVAALANAHGVHLGQDDLPVPAARRRLPARCLVGLSTHTLPQVDDAAAVVPDYIAVGPMFPTPAKPHTATAGPQTLAMARRRTSLPLVAIGGINDQNVREVLQAGPDAICVSQAVIAQRDSQGAAAKLRALIDRARPRG